ncbi:hypothetical protein GYMLUDRAFT_248401 [Collybiopsis luxurians FD-317 M1]|uniref:Uncharacterized protein n=1 Tax=Collybiopsis luxurians FD-317 M1 TaxID=944289 RepID=A0A0D0CCK3_9AGAR|nr:hypothetical protein GYMLUDRAFT_248401 [Collybiopsis luxurians FD-317 M1]
MLSHNFQVSEIIAFNHTPSDGKLWLIHSPTAAYELKPLLNAGDKDVRFDLTTIGGLSDGMTQVVNVFDS